MCATCGDQKKTLMCGTCGDQKTFMCGTCGDQKKKFMCGTCGDQKKTLDSLKLELEKVGNHFIGARNRSLVFYKSNKDFNN